MKNQNNLRFFLRKKSIIGTWKVSSLNISKFIFRKNPYISLSARLRQKTNGFKLLRRREAPQDFFGILLCAYAFCSFIFSSFRDSRRLPFYKILADAGNPGRREIPISKTKGGLIESAIPRIELFCSQNR